MIKLCKGCGHEFETNRKNKEYCKRNCANRTYNGFQHLTWRSDLPTSTIGAISEMMVCADLLKKGFQVFRAVSSACSCDLVLLNGEAVKLIEVRTATKNLNTGHLSVTKKGKYDILAIVIIEEDLILYEPPLP